MNYRGCLLCLMLLIFVGGSMTSQAVSSSLQLTVDSNQGVYSIGEAIGLTLALKNVGDRNLLLFHPLLFGEGWQDWKFTIHVTKTGQRREMEIMPRLVTARKPRPEETQFQALAPGKAISIRLFFPGKDSQRTSGDVQWVALLPITRDDAEHRSEKSLRQKYQIKGGFAYLSAGDGKSYLELDDIVNDVFGTPGRYNLEFRYINRYDYFLAPDTQNKYLLQKEVPDAWTGELNGKITLKIES